MLIFLCYTQPSHMTFADGDTSAFMGPNTRAFMIHPSKVKVKDLEGEVHDLGIIFISKDLAHDKHQVTCPCVILYLCLRWRSWNGRW